MKKTFRFLALALMATALSFTACSKDDDEEINPNPAPQQEEQNPDDPTPNAVIAFKGDTTLMYTLDRFSGMIREADTVYGILDAWSFERYSDDSASYVFPPRITVATKYYVDSVKNFSIVYCHLYNNYENIMALSSVTENYYDWAMFSNGIYNDSSYDISDLDLNSMTLTLTLHCIMYDRYEQIINGVNVSGEEYDGEELLAYFQNVSLKLRQ